METSRVLDIPRAEGRRAASEADARANLASAYDTFAPSLYRYLLTMLSDVSEAEDALQEVFLGFMRRSRPGSIRDLQAYLFRAARNQALMALRKRRKQGPRWAEDAACWIDNDACTGADREQAIDVARASQQLSPEQREVVSLKLGEGLTFREIADVLGGVSPNTAASRYRLALAHLRKLLKDGDSHD